MAAQHHGTELVCPALASFTLGQYLARLKSPCGTPVWRWGMKPLCGSWQAVVKDLTPTVAPSLLCFELSQTRAPSARLCLRGTDTAPGDSSPAGISGLQNTVSTELEGSQQSEWRVTLQGISKPRQQSRCLRLPGNLARGISEVSLMWVQGS